MKLLAWYEVAKILFFNKKMNFWRWTEVIYFMKWKFHWKVEFHDDIEILVCYKNVRRVDKKNIVNNLVISFREEILKIVSERAKTVFNKF